MAGHLSRIYGTEQDKINCPFYFKMGACRHGDRCSRQHNKPTESQTVMVRNMYQSPFNQYNHMGDPLFDVNAAERHFEEFWEDVFVEMTKYGEIEEINVCSNNGEHLRGNVYLKFYNEDDAAKALSAVNGRFYNGVVLRAELSPVTDFSEAKCRQYRDGSCNRAGNCNFMHVREPPRSLSKKMFHWQTLELKKKGQESQREAAAEDNHGRGSSRDRERRRSRSRSRGRHGGGYRGRSRSRSRDRHRRSRSPGGYRSYSRRDRSRSPSPKRQRRDDMNGGGPMPPAMGMPPMPPHDPSMPPMQYMPPPQ